jgi:predicted RNA-binding Zn-ribbon protein involved in translation (DUF1610 family)
MQEARESKAAGSPGKCASCGKGLPKGMKSKMTRCPHCGKALKTESSAISEASDGVTNWKAVSPESRKKIGPIVKHYMKDPHPFTACVRDNRKRFGDRAEQVCAVVKDMGMRTTKWRKGGKKLSEAVVVEMCLQEFEAVLSSPEDIDALREYLLAAGGPQLEEALRLDEAATDDPPARVADASLEEAATRIELERLYLREAGITSLSPQMRSHIAKMSVQHRRRDRSGRFAHDIGEKAVPHMKAAQNVVDKHEGLLYGQQGGYTAALGGREHEVHMEMRDVGTGRSRGKEIAVFHGHHESEAPGASEHPSNVTYHDDPEAAAKDFHERVKKIAPKGKAAIKKSEGTDYPMTKPIVPSEPWKSGGYGGKPEEWKGSLMMPDASFHGEQYGGTGEDVEHKYASRAEAEAATRALHKLRERDRQRRMREFDAEKKGVKSKSEKPPTAKEQKRSAAREADPHKDWEGASYAREALRKIKKEPKDSVRTTAGGRIRHDGKQWKIENDRGGDQTTHTDEADAMKRLHKLDIEAWDREDELARTTTYSRPPRRKRPPALK